MTFASADPQEVYLNVPFDAAYEPLFITLVGTLICLGQKPHCVLEIRETGQGRLARIADLLRSCAVSIHDLSRQSRPPRFNMPFELGLACSLALSGVSHEVVVLDAAPYRLDRALSNYKGRDPLIHYNRCDALVSCILDQFQENDEPSPGVLRQEARYFRRLARSITTLYGVPQIFRAAPFRTLVGAVTEHAIYQRYIAP